MADPACASATLLSPASQAIVPLINGCARIIGKKNALRFSRAIDYFGPPIAASWRESCRNKRPEEIRAGLEHLSALSEEEARREATAALARSATASPPDQATAIDYLAAIPATMARYVPRHRDSGAPLPWPLDREQAFLGFLPIHLPPFAPGSSLANTPYRLENVLGSGDAGVVYRVVNSSEPSQKRVIKFCLDNALVGSLAHEREHLNRLMTLGLARWSPGIARLYGYSLDTQIPYLVYEFSPGVDLTAEVRRVRQETGAGYPAAQALELVTQIAGALAFAHGRGLVYCDLKPANILISDECRVMSDESNNALPRADSSRVPKLTDIATSVVSAGLAAQTCPISSREGAPLVSAATHVRLLHGSSSSMYMSAELRRGDLPRPHHDIYSLGVLWFQLLVGDVTHEMHPGWAEELLSEFQTPKNHVEVLQRCLGYYKRRPTSAGDLLPILQSLNQIEGTRPVVTFVSERLRKLDERFARASGMVSAPVSAGEGQRTGAGSESVESSAEPSSVETEILPKTDESQETVWCQETRILGAGFIPRPGATPAQINRDAELSRLKRLLSHQMANQAYDEARETVEVLMQLYPDDLEGQQARTFLSLLRQ